ncbi:hypothetical protein ACN47E_007124 [Coniothyrium glycines]
MSVNTSPPAESGSEVHEIETEHLGFKVLSQGKEGPKKVKILPEPWPTNSVPPASATLLSIASKPGLLAAAGPHSLVVTSTEGVRKAFQSPIVSESGDRDVDVVSSFTPDITIHGVPTLRHVAFSNDGEFLVISSEDQGRLAVFDVELMVKQGKKDATSQIETDGIPLRALVPNPASEFAHYFAAVYDNGKLVIVNVADNNVKVIRDEGVTSVDWSARGKAVVAGLQDGSSGIYMTEGILRGVIPRPPELDDSYTVAALTWLDQNEFFLVHSVREQNSEDAQENKYHIVKSTKGWASHTYHAVSYDTLWASSDIPRRALPPRFSVTRLRHWKPDLNDMLVITSSHTDAIAVFASTSSKISPDQEVTDQLMLVGIDDAKKAAVPRTVYGEDMDSVFIGEALDLSSKEKILRPIPALEEINEAPWPLPAYMALTHEGVLAAWWIVWNRSIEAGERYPGLIVGSENQQSETPAATPSKPNPFATSQTPTAFGQSASTTPSTGAFGKPTATFGIAGFSSPTPALMRPTPPGFGTPGFGAAASNLPAPTFGKPAQPAFGAPSSMGKPAQPAFGAAATIASPAQPAFGAASTIASPAQPAFGTASTIGKPTQPAFGSASAVGSTVGATFGSTGGFGKASPWGTSPQTSQTQASPFSAAAGGTSGFAKFGQTTGTSAFSSFGSNHGSSQSGFGGLDQGQQKAGFGSLKAEPSFGSTVTVDSGVGSTLPSWANTPTQGSGGIFGQTTKSSFNTSSFESKQSDTSELDDADRRKRDEATPTPQVPPPQKSEGLFGLAGGFKLGTTFSSDGTAKDDPAKPAAPASGSFFSSDFANTLGKLSTKPPATPLKESPEDASTTPASQPKQTSFFPSTTPAKDSATPKAVPPTKEISAPSNDAPLPPDFTMHKPPTTDDAPLPPDFVTSKPKQPADDDLPPLAGSPPIKVEAPSSEVDLSPSDDEDDDETFSEEDEQEEGEEEVEESSLTDATPHSKPVKTSWTLQDSANPARVFPPAPTPPTTKSGATSHSGRSASPAQSLFGQVSKPASAKPSFGSAGLFGTQASKGPSIFSQANKPISSPKLSFLPPASQPQETLRSPSPVRSSSAASRVRRDPAFTPGVPLSTSLQQSKPPTPQPQISDLQDEEDERMREQLAQPIEPSRSLDEFVAYQNYTGKPAGKTGHAAQIETIYRDINGMVDALGWNARSIKSFTQFHKQPQSGHKVDRRVLDDVEDEGPEGSWFEKFSLCEIGALKELEEELEQVLDAGRVQDVLDKLQQLARLLREKAKLMTRLNDIRRQIINRKDPEKTEALRKAPLPKELADGQKAVRHDYARLLTSLSKAEDAIISLRSGIASHNAQNGKTGAIPTMDAVRRTCLKLANMAETKNNDIVLLEAQMKRIGLGEPTRSSSSPSGPVGTPRRARTSMRNSIADTPFATPPTNRSTMSLKELNRRALTPDVDATPTPSKGYGLFYTPEGSPTPANELARTGELVEEHLDSLRETARRRKQVAAGLKKALIARGVKTTKVI